MRPYSRREPSAEDTAQSRQNVPPICLSAKERILMEETEAHPENAVLYHKIHMPSS
jgi:hypothetical protein